MQRLPTRDVGSGWSPLTVWDQQWGRRLGRAAARHFDWVENMISFSVKKINQSFVFPGNEDAIH